MRYLILNEPELGWVILENKLQSERSDFALVTDINEICYIIGGKKKGDIKDEEYLDSYETLNLGDKNDKWVTGEKKLNTKRCGLQACIDNNRIIYAIGGKI